mgnify:CR=1 FL=1
MLQRITDAGVSLFIRQGFDRTTLDEIAAAAGISRRISALVNNLPAPLVFADSGNVEVFLNDPARHLLGLASGAQLRPPIVAQALARLVRGAADLGNDNADLVLGSDGRGFEIEHQGVGYKVQTQQIDQDSLVGRVWLFTDVTREKAFRLELAELTGLLQLTVENVSQGVALVGADLRMMLWNESFIELLGYSRESVYAGADFLALARITAERGELGGEGVDAALEGLRASLRSIEERTLELRREDGRVLEIRRKSLAGGRFILTARDKTDEHRAARLKDELVSTVSHELRTPLTSISGALALSLIVAATLLHLAPTVAGTRTSSVNQFVVLTSWLGATSNDMANVSTSARATMSASLSAGRTEARLACTAE